MGSEGVSLGNLRTTIVKLMLDNNERNSFITNSIEHFKVQLKLGEYTDALRRGEACPLCSSLEHEFVLEIEDVQIQLDVEEKNLVKNKEEYSKFQQLEMALELNDTLSAKAKQNEEYVDRQIDDCRNKVDSHLQTFRWVGFDPEQPRYVTEQLEQADAMRASLKSLTEKSDKNDEDLEQISKEFNRYGESLQKLKQELYAANAEYSIISKQLKQHNDLDVSRFESSVLEELSEKLKIKIQQDRDRYEALINSLQKLKDEELKNSLRLENLISTKKEEEG